VPSQLLPTPQHHGAKGLAATFEQLSSRYGAITTEGCTENQRAQAQSMARVTHELATTAARLPDPESPESGSLRYALLYAQFNAGLEQFEKRRQAMQQDLERMRAVRLR
jgi:hypothetical protein